VRIKPDDELLSVPAIDESDHGLVAEWARHPGLTDR
jgi:hypothetical protein